MPSFLDSIGLNRVIEKLKQHTEDRVASITKTDIGLSNTENKSSADIRGELTYSDVVNGLGYIPAEASDLSVYKFEIVRGNLMLSYPDDSPAPDVHIDGTGRLIWSYVE